MPWIYRRYGDVVGTADIASPVRSSKNLKRLGADLSLGQHFIGWTLTAALVAVLVLGAASRRTAALMPGEALAQGRKQTHSDAVGVWEGTTLAVCPGSPANRCNAQQKVTMTLVEGENSQLGGSYKCAYGNMNCYNMNETGKVVDGMLTGRLLRLRVLMPDGTSCMFNGRLADGSIDGGYSCYTGGSLLERGSWRAKRILEGRISQHRRHAAAIAMKDCAWRERG